MAFRVQSLTIPILVAAGISAGALQSFAQCPVAPVAPNHNANETTADTAFEAAVTMAAGCLSKGMPGCAQSTTALTNLATQALNTSGVDQQCAATGTGLTQAERDWYVARAKFWSDLYYDLMSQSAAVQAGAYTFRDKTKTLYLGYAPSATPPNIAKVSDGTSSLNGTIDVLDFSGNQPSRLYACVWSTKPSSTSSDCTDPSSTVKPAALTNASAGKDGNSDSYLPAVVDGSYTLTLATPVARGQYVTLTQRATVSGRELAPISSAAQSVSPAAQCNHNPDSTPYSDCDMTVNLIGGVEQAAQSALPSATTPFLRLFTRAGPDSGNWQRVQVWAYVRLLGAPQASSTNGVVSVVTDPAGNITTQTFSGIGTAVDFMLGPEVMLTPPGKNLYSISFIAGYGGTTPLTANTVTQAFKTPAFGTVECATLRGRFTQQFASANIISGTSNNATAPSCLVNANSMTSGSGVIPITYTPINTVAFTNQDRTNFLGKAMFGIRTMDRFLGSGNTSCGDSDSTSKIGPCERGIVDFIFGQDATVTGGAMHDWIFKVDAVHPLPVASVSFIYLFGSASLRLGHNTNYPPLVLQAGDVSALTGNGSSAVPNTSVIVLPLTQPNRDFYRFGAGVNVNNIFKKLFSAAAKGAS